MPNPGNLGRWLVIFGLVLAVIGGLIWALSRTGLPLGRLPGDFYIPSGQISCLVPLGTSLVLSILLTVVLNIILRVLNR